MNFTTLTPYSRRYAASGWVLGLAGTNRRYSPFWQALGIRVAQPNPQPPRNIQRGALFGVGQGEFDYGEFDYGEFDYGEFDYGEFDWSGDYDFSGTDYSGYDFSGTDYSGYDLNAVPDAATSPLDSSGGFWDTLQTTGIKLGGVLLSQQLQQLFYGSGSNNPNQNLSGTAARPVNQSPPQSSAFSLPPSALLWGGAAVALLIILTRKK